MLAGILACAVCFLAVTGPVEQVWASSASEGSAAEEDGTTGKYVSDVFIAYGDTQEEAVEWLEANGWEPIKGNNDFNAGKSSSLDDDVVAAMGIKRTNKPENAITDMAVMNMGGGYSFPDYERLLNEKKAEINEFINNFLVVIQEFRDNYNGLGGKEGKARADLCYSLLNRLYDGDPADDYAVNDTGLPLGDLFLAKTMQEGNSSGGDLEQIILESCGVVVVTIERLLALGADTNGNTWLERLSELSGDAMTENLEKYIPEMEGQDLAPSAVTTLLNQYYGDTAKKLADQWDDVHQMMLDYEAYNDTNDLWQYDGESDKDYANRITAFFKDLEKEDVRKAGLESSAYQEQAALYTGLNQIPYEGAWGETLADFFNPADEMDLGTDVDAFLPMAAALSEGQRASMDILTLSSLLMVGFGDLQVYKKVLPDMSALFEKETTSVSCYTGVNRGAFRAGVALTSEAEMEKNMGNGDAFNELWDNWGIYSIVSYCGLLGGALMLVTGTYCYMKGIEFIYTANYVNNFLRKKQLVSLFGDLIKHLETIKTTVNPATKIVVSSIEEIDGLTVTQALEYTKAEQLRYSDEVAQFKKSFKSVGGRTFMVLGGILMLGGALLKAYQLYKYYDKTFTPIPRMIVDKSDIVTYLTDENGKPILDEKGNQRYTIEFNTYEYYVAVRCNRDPDHRVGDWQDGVEEYEEMGCGDVADLNVDQGQEWLALYTVKSKTKGDPILADSLILQYDNKNMPSGCTQNLHLFCFTFAADLADTAYCYNRDEGGLYFFWDTDTAAFATAPTASAFSAGKLALSGVAGLLIGIVGTILVMGRTRKKEKQKA